MHARGPACTTASSSCFGGARHRIDLHGADRRQAVMVYGQTEVTRDLMQARAAAGAADRLRGRGRQPARLRRRRAERALRAGRRRARARLRLHRRLRRLPRRQPRQRAGGRAARPTSGSIRSAGSACSPTMPPVSHELIYSNHERGFALCSMRSPHAQPLLRAVLARRQGRAVERRRVLGRAARAGSTRRPPRRWSPARRSRRASRRCAASSPSRCASAACSSPATRRTSCRRPAPRG